jgi:RimJ/RimL family protein N-acetyltransferase
VPSPRLRYRRVTVDEALALVQEMQVIDGPRASTYPDEGTRFFALRMLERDTGDADVFGMYHVIEVEGDAIVGHVGFHGGPDDDRAVRIGYAIAEDARGQGYATEAVAWIVSLSGAQPDVQLVRADTGTGNLASQRVLEHGGFVQVRADSHNLFYELAVTS